MPSRTGNEPPLELDALERTLCLQEGEEPQLPAWLAASHRAPRSFWPQLKEAQDRFVPLPAKSTPFGEYDFYHDLVVRNLELTTPALCWHDAADLRPGAISYAELAELASQRAAAWLAAGAAPGDVVCIVRPIGVELLVSLVAALKAGLVVSLLTPVGRRFVTRRLEALGPAHVDTAAIYRPLLSEWEQLFLPERGGRPAADADRSYSYSSGSVAMLLFDPCWSEGVVPRPVTSDAAYLCPMRDGLLALGLRRGQAAAAPGWSSLGTQPALLLACLFGGGTYVHLELTDLQRSPALVATRPLRALGVSTALRELLLGSGQAVGERCGLWFRDPAGGLDIGRWQRFVRAAGLAETWAANLKWDAAHGGCSLFSPRRRGQPHFDVLPSAGVPWQLANPAQPSQAAVSDHGLFAILPLGSEGEDQAPAPTTSVVAPRGQIWIFAGARGTRYGHSYPVSDVCAAVSDLSACLGATVCEVPLLGGDMEAALVLLFFVGRGGAEQPGSELRALIERRIREQVGLELSPDRIEIVPLFPRRDADGEIDHDWCRDEYLSGRLAVKSRDELYGCLSRLREALAAQRGDMPPQGPEQGGAA